VQRDSIANPAGVYSDPVRAQRMKDDNMKGIIARTVAPVLG
jgi:hypothetical protein